MLDQSPDYRRYILASSMSSAPGQTIAGQRHDGSTYASMLLDAQLGGGGARIGADGPDTFGLLHSPGGACANVEVNEANFPIRYLWRAERVDSGGPGTHRGGVGGCHALTPHRSTGPIEMTVWAHGIEQPAATGLFGGEAATPNAFLVLRNAAGAVGPGMAHLDPSVLPGPAEVPEPKERLTVGPGDVVLSLCSGGGGIGDPLDRPADVVMADVREGLVSPQGAARDYGVAVVADGDCPDGWRVDEGATVELRQRRRQQRRVGGEPGPGPVLGMAGTWSAACPRCGTALEGRGTLVAERLPASYRWAPAAELAGTGRFSVERVACAACLTQLDSVVRLTTVAPAG
jgi:N-methylhydantoinase B